MNGNISLNIVMKHKGTKITRNWVCKPHFKDKWYYTKQFKVLTICRIPHSTTYSLKILDFKVKFITFLRSYVSWPDRYYLMTITFAFTLSTLQNILNKQRSKTTHFIMFMVFSCFKSNFKTQFFIIHYWKLVDVGNTTKTRYEL